MHIYTTVINICIYAHILIYIYIDVHVLPCTPTFLLTTHNLMQNLLYRPIRIYVGPDLGKFGKVN